MCLYQGADLSGTTVTDKNELEGGSLAVRHVGVACEGLFGGVSSASGAVLMSVCRAGVLLLVETGVRVLVEVVMRGAKMLRKFNR